MQVFNHGVSAPVQFSPALHLPAQNEDDDRLEPARPRLAVPVGRPPLQPPWETAKQRVVTFKAPDPRKWDYIDVSYLEQNGYAGVDFNRLRTAQNVPPQAAAGEYRGFCCGPNSIARAAILMGRSIGDVNNLYRHFRYNGFGNLRFGPDPLQMKEALEKDDAFRGIGVAATRVDRWEDLLGQLEWHVAHAKTPFMALLLYGQTAMHWLNVVALSPDRQYCVVLDTDGQLYRMPMEELHAELDKDKAIGPVLKKLNGVRFFP